MATGDGHGGRYTFLAVEEDVVLHPAHMCPNITDARFIADKFALLFYDISVMTGAERNTNMATSKEHALKLLENPAEHIGVLGTASKDGRPNIAYISSTRAMDDGSIIIGLGNNQSLANLEENPHGVYFVIERFPVTFKTPGYRIYLEARAIEREGSVLDATRKFIAEEFDPNAAKMTTAAVTFDITAIRPMIEMPIPSSEE